VSIEATRGEIAALLRLAELDAQAQDPTPDTLPARREASRRQVTGVLLERYETLLEIGREPPIVPIERGGCSGCHVRLPTMMEYRARGAPAIHTCPRCRRMLYAPEMLREEGTRGAGPEKEAGPEKKAGLGRGAPAAERS
jgi:predicted  nucleic acid-binding Zn-ribbon protein